MHADFWGVSETMAAPYLQFLDEHRYFATAIKCPYVMMVPKPSVPGGVERTPGMLVAQSTGQTTRLQKENAEQHAAGLGISRPYWYDLEVYWFQDLAFLNFNGMHDSKYNGHRLPYTFGQFLHTACMQKGVAFATETVFGGAVLSPLRSMLHRLQIPVWAEITVGSSYHGYFALDAYLRIFGHGIESATEEAQFLLNTYMPPEKRTHRFPEDWWQCDDWVSVGQRECVAEWNVQFLAGMVPYDATQGNRRMEVFQRHLTGGSTRSRM